MLKYISTIQIQSTVAKLFYLFNKFHEIQYIYISPIIKKNHSNVNIINNIDNDKIQLIPYIYYILHTR